MLKEPVRTPSGPEGFERFAGFRPIRIHVYRRMQRKLNQEDETHILKKT